MSEHDHPVHYVSCCKPFVRWGPSGSPIRFHRFNCEVAPNQQIQGPIVRRAELASHAESNADELDDGYLDYWADRAYEMEEGK